MSSDTSVRQILLIMNGSGLLAGLSLVLTSCSPSTDKEFSSGVHVPTEYEQCAVVVDNYVRETYRWDTTSYRITVDRIEDDATVFLVTYAEDEKGTTPGGGESFEIYINCLDARVIRVLQFQ